MALLIQKFGGTSVGSIERMMAVAERVMKTRQQGHQVVVVVSAMSGETDRLIHLANEIQNIPDPREYSMLVSTGEQVSAALVAMCLQHIGCKARSFNAAQIVIRTENRFQKARITSVDTENLQRCLDEGCVPVITGFQGIDDQGSIATLGRGGSDTTAVAIAAALAADECQIYTDVDGVYTADPRVVPQAQRLERITFEEMLELSSSGAKVLQIRSVEFAGKYNVKLRVLSSFVEGPGTLITYEEKGMEEPLVSGIAYNKSEAKVTLFSLPDRPGLAAEILGPISDAGIGIDMIIQNAATEETIDFTFTLHREDYQKALQILTPLAATLGASRVGGDLRIAKLSLIGVGMRSHAGIASTMFRVLGAEGINIQMIATSEIKVSVIMDEKYLELGVRALHTAFGLDREPEEEVDPITIEGIKLTV